MQGDVTFMGKTVESLVMKFDQAKYKEFLSSGSKSPRALQYRKVSSEIRSRVSSETSSKTVSSESIIAGCITLKARVNVSHETREINVVEGQPGHTLPLPQLHVIRDSQ